MIVVLEFLQAVGPVLIGLFSVLGAWLGHKAHQRKWQHSIAAASAPSAVAWVSGGALAEKHVAEEQTIALNRIADGLQRLADASGDQHSAEVRRGRQLELLEEAVKLRRAVEHAVELLHNRPPR